MALTVRFGNIHQVFLMTKTEFEFINTDLCRRVDEGLDQGMVQGGNVTRSDLIELLKELFKSRASALADTLESRIYKSDSLIDPDEWPLAFITEVGTCNILGVPCIFNYLEENQRPSSQGALCQICSTNATGRCSRCHQVFYCCETHKNDDWSSHKRSCGFAKTLRERRDELIQRYRDFEEVGERHPSMDKFKEFYC
jgi:hypothetical protein